MCGIAGIVGEGAQAQAWLAGEMAALLRHRGPDDAGLWVSDGVALAHRRLSILDRTPAGRQPMPAEGDRACVTYNGEIYNYLELREELGAKGHRFRTRTDTEVLLAAYAEWGDDCLARMNGMWAFALWDAPGRRLVLARDRFGKKPLYYVTDGRGRLFFASEMKALFLIPGLHRAVNDRAVVDFCTQRVVGHGEETFVRPIRQVPAATCLVWREGEIRQRIYWALPPPAEAAPASRRDLEDLAATLEDSVRLRLRADTPVGCLVSGGLDSSTVGCLMRKLLPAQSPVHTFTTFTDPPAEESKGVDLLLRRGGFHPHFHTPTARSFWDDLPGILWHEEQPFSDGSMAAHYALMREARRAGIPVLLSGQGADELFAGYPTYLWVYLGTQIRRGQWLRALRWMRGAARGGRMSATRIAFYALPRPVRAAARRALIRRGSRWIGPGVAAAAVGREEHLAALPTDELDAYLRNSITQWTLPGFLHYEDRNSMAFGVETRLPFLDYRLVEKIFRISSDEKLAGGVSKSVLRRIAEPIVPAEIVRRTAKQGYPAPLARWLRELSGEVREVAHSSAAARCPLVRIQGWRPIVERFLAGSGERDLDPVWRGLVCILWHERFFRVSREALLEEARRGPTARPG